jgi:hypothetical protein
MIKLKIKRTDSNYCVSQVFEFKNYREAHRDLDMARHCKGTECAARRLEHYSDHETTHDDFGKEIGKDCVLELFEEVNQMKQATVDRHKALMLDELMKHFEVWQKDKNVYNQNEIMYALERVKNNLEGLDSAVNEQSESKACNPPIRDRAFEAQLVKDLEDAEAFHVQVASTGLKKF